MTISRTDPFTTPLWDLVTRKELRAKAPVGGHKVSIESFAFSPDGKTLASASSDYTLKLWNMATLRNVATLRLGKPVLFAKFTPNGEKLIAYSWQHGDAQAQLHVWSAPFTDAGSSKR
jgi:COMPASS component SWD3